MKRKDEVHNDGRCLLGESSITAHTLQRWLKKAIKTRKPDYGKYTISSVENACNLCNDIIRVLRAKNDKR